MKDVAAGSGSASPRSLTNVNGTLLFTANDGVHGDELWASDGTAAGTRLVADIGTNGGSDSGQFTQVGSLVFFSAGMDAVGRELFAIPVSALAPDTDGDGVPDASDNCPYAANTNQLDTGGIGAGSAPDGIGDAPASAAT